MPCEPSIQSSRTARSERYSRDEQRADRAARTFDALSRGVRATTTCLIMADHNRLQHQCASRRPSPGALPRERIVVLFNDAVWPTTPVSSAAIRSFTIPGTICRSW